MTEDFFEPVPEPPPPERHEPPVWWQPPPDEFAALVPERRILARTARGVVLQLSHIDAFRQGCSLRIRVGAHRQAGISEADWWDLHETVIGGARMRHRRGSGGLPDDLLRLGVQFPDGRKATTTGGPELNFHDDREPDGPVLVRSGGGGGGSDRVVTSTWSLWLWPLPPAEPFD
ncbi:MAG TPA: hypothetical protein VK906_01150, partial [Egicoccus sp.]